MLFILIITNCKSPVEKFRQSNPIYQFENYFFVKDSPLISRVQRIPDFLLNFLKKLDKKENYVAYMPNQEELKLIEKTMDELPSFNKKMLEERLVGIYFMENFVSSGYTDITFTKNGKLYCYMVFHPSVLKLSISEWLTKKEKTCFILDNNELDIKIKVNDQSAFLAILSHESTHLVDYTNEINPYVDDEQKKVVNNKFKETEYTKGIWENYNTPLPSNDFPLRKNITFYGFNNGPKISIKDARFIYTQLSKSPFASLYSTLNWAEDLAEMVTVYHLTKKLNYPYQIEIYEKGKLLESFNPIEFPKVVQRFQTIQLFYR